MLNRETCEDIHQRLSEGTVAKGLPTFSPVRTFKGPSAYTYSHVFRIIVRPQQTVWPMRTYQSAL